MNDDTLPPHPDYPCRSDGRCQYAIDSGAESEGHCPRGRCVMPLAADAVTGEMAQVALRVLYGKGISITTPAVVTLTDAMRAAIEAALAARGTK